MQGSSQRWNYSSFIWPCESANWKGKKKWQKIEYLDKEKCFLDEVKRMQALNNSARHHPSCHPHTPATGHQSWKKHWWTLSYQKVFNIALMIM